eukprot:3173610-Amphidinium_carterae.1
MPMLRHTHARRALGSWLDDQLIDSIEKDARHGPDISGIRAFSQQKDQIDTQNFKSSLYQGVNLAPFGTFVNFQGAGFGPIGTRPGLGLCIGKVLLGDHLCQVIWLANGLCLPAVLPISILTTRSYVHKRSPQG